MLTGLDLIVVEGVSAMVRWLHVIAGIAWIGSSFYFIALDLGLRPRSNLPQGVQGEAWQVHGGGFYHLQKYTVAPAELPKHLTWFKWEAYTTWLSGFALLVLVYYLGADLYLIDRDVLDLAPWQAVALSLGGLLAAWAGYEALCRSPLGRSEMGLALLLYVLLVAMTWGFTHVFTGRGAFTQVGALIGTMMVANVFVVIIPNQKRIVAALLAGQAPDPALGKQAKQRSLHNNYLTLPVIFLMVSNHFPLFFATEFNWLIAAIVLALGPIIRHHFNERHAGRPAPWWPWPAVIVGICAIIGLSMAGPARRAVALPPTTTVQVQEIVSTRCAMCHTATPAWAGIAAAPKGLVLETPDQITANRRLIALHAGLSQAMPPGNATEMTLAERAALLAWLQDR